MSIIDETLKKFLDEIVMLTVKEFPNEIVSFILFGSATTGEWIRGKSDIDCIILIKNRNMTKVVEEFLNELLLKLDSKYKLNLSETCTIYKKTQNPALNLILKTESMMMFGRPFYVLSEDQFDLKNAKIRHDLKIQIGLSVIASLNMFLQRIKNTGVILYGKDIRKEISESIPRIEKIKASFNALLLLLMSFVILPLEPKIAFSHAVKANLWACDDVLFAFEKPLSTTSKEVQEIKKMFENSDLELNHLDEALKYKRKINIQNLNRWFVLKYTLKSIGFVFDLYFQALRKMFS
ncbi:MAG: nucleotidyltransferase domain-containing protein [Nitrosopumilus sp.]|nr:nucleotidyltransferase domain-containing protein [Nitrosopumilus sp.]